MPRFKVEVEQRFWKPGTVTVEAENAEAARDQVIDMIDGGMQPEDARIDWCDSYSPDGDVEIGCDAEEVR